MSIGDKDLTQRAQIKRYFWTANCELRLQPSHPKDNSNQQFLKQKKTIIYRSNHFSFGYFLVNQQVMQGKLLQILEACRSFRGH